MIKNDKEIYNEALRDLCDLYYEDGLHTGRWDDEYAREESSEDYLVAMIALAEKYHLSYDKDLKNYVDENSPEHCAMDLMGSELQEIIKKHLIKILVYKNE